MKKILMMSTILVGAVAFTGNAFADGGAAAKPVAKKASAKKAAKGTKAPAETAAAPKAGSGLTVTVGGFMDFQAGFADQDSVFKTGAFSRDVKFANDTEVHIKVSGVADSGLKYGAVIELNADVSADADADGGNADKTYLFIESSAGRLEAGANSPVTTSMQVSAASIARATGGVDGDFYRFANLGAAFITTQALPAREAATGGTREDANKLSYYSPVFSGLQLGASYTPDEGDSGTSAASTGKLNGNNENVFDVGLTYKNQFNGGVGVKASAIGEFGNAELAGTQDTNAWGVGLELDYKGFALAGSYTDWQDSGLVTGATDDNQHSWTVGASYETGPFGVSVTYLDSTGSNGTTDQDFQNVSLGADYKLAPGLVPYVEVSFFDTDDNVAGTPDNSGSVVLIGTQLNF